MCGKTYCILVRSCKYVRLANEVGHTILGFNGSVETALRNCVFGERSDMRRNVEANILMYFGAPGKL